MNIGDKFEHVGKNTIFEITDEFSVTDLILMVYPLDQRQQAIKNLMLNKTIMEDAIRDGRLVPHP